MNYLEWNNCISDYFFNPTKAGQDVNLYITRKDIILIGKDGKADNLVWQDYISAIKAGLPDSGENTNIIDKAVYCFEQWKNGVKSIQGINITSPCYLAYLVFFILPLTEESFDFHAKDYYGPLRAFLLANNIGQKIDSLQTLETLWSDLEEWSIIKENGNRGYFSLGKFSSNYKYVGKPYSQCVFSPNAIKKLPLLFSKSGMVPDSLYTPEQIKDNLVRFGISLLGLKKGVFEIIKKFETNEIGRSIIEIVLNEYKHWNGESQELSQNETTKAKRDFTSRLYLQFKKNDNSGTIVFSYRLRSSNVYPEDLQFGEFENIHERGVWSKTLALPFQEAFELKDNLNKWTAKFLNRDIRLFINGSSHEFNTNYWIETDNLIKTEWMYLLCKDSIRTTVTKWGEHFTNHTFAPVTLNGIPENYSLFKFLNPTENHPNIQILRFNSNKEVRLINALQKDHRIYTNDYMPEVEIINSDGTETIYLEYKDSEQTILLNKKSVQGNRWTLPKDIELDTDFYVKMKDQNFSGYNKSYTITTARGSALKVDGKQLVRRDSFGRSTSADLSQYCLGSNIINPDRRSQRYYSPGEVLFLSINPELSQNIPVPEYNNHEGNTLLSYLSLKSCSKTQDFYSAFELLHNKKFVNDIEDNVDYSKIRKASLNFFDYLGYLDYDYETNDIIVNPPQLVFIPAKQGRKVLLIGARDEELVRSIIHVATKYNLQVEITPQLPDNKHLLLPDAITIRAFGTPKESYGERNLVSLAEELKITFNQREFSQLALQHFSADIEQYKNNMLANNKVPKDDWDWAPYVFNPQTLNLNISLNKDFVKDYVLAEYRLRPWEYYHLLWIDGNSYVVDKNWGKFLVLRHLNKQVILFDKIKDKVAIPYQLPLPRVLAESIMTLSGLAPSYKNIDGHHYRVYENIPGMFTENLFNKLGQNPQPKDL